MKRLIAGLVILSIIIALGVAGILYTNKFVAELSSSLELARESANEGEFARAEELCKETKTRFEEKEKVLSLFFNHELIEQVEENLSVLPDYAEESEINVFLSSVERVKTNLFELKESQKHIF